MSPEGLFTDIRIYLAVWGVFLIACIPHPDDETPVVLLVFPESYYEGALESGETIVFQAPAWRVPSVLTRLLFMGGSGNKRPGEPCQLAYTSRWRSWLPTAVNSSRP